MAKLLLESGADPNLAWDGRTALHQCAIIGTRDVAAILIAHGANVNATDRPLGFTPLHFAAAECNGPVADILINSGAEKGWQSKQKETPLQVAKRRGCSAVAAKLSGK